MNRFQNPLEIYQYVVIRYPKDFDRTRSEMLIPHSVSFFSPR